MDDDLVCSDLCEEQGFARQAELLRALAGAGNKLYVLAERGYQNHDGVLELPPDEFGEPLAGRPRAVFVDRDEALRSADLRNARVYRDREVNILDFGFSLDALTDHPEEALNREIGAILGRDFDIFGGRGEAALANDGPNPFPPDATDEQMVRVVQLFNVRFFHVIEIGVAH